MKQMLGKRQYLVMGLGTFMIIVGQIAWFFPPDTLTAFDAWQVGEWLILTGLFFMLWGIFIAVRMSSTMTPLEKFNEIQCKHCEKWIKRSWRTCPFCSRDQS